MSGKLMAELIGGMKNMNILEQKVTLKSSLKENQIAELEQLAEAIVASMK